MALISDDGAVLHQDAGKFLHGIRFNWHGAKPPTIRLTEEMKQVLEESAAGRLWFAEVKEGWQVNWGD